MGSEFTPATTGLSRVFLQEGRAGPNNPLDYMSCLRAMSLSQSSGDVTAIECPHPTRPGQYVRIGYFQSGEERATITLEGRFALDIRSRLMRLAKNRCAVDVQLHFGDCEDLSNPMSWKKVVMLEQVALTSYSTEDLGSLQDADTAAVNESVELSADRVYDITPAVWTRKADDLITSEIVGAAICDDVQCGGDCGALSGGCNRIFLVTAAAGGSPGTMPDVLYSPDGGVTWRANDIDTIPTAEAPSGVECLKGYLAVTASGATYGLHIALLSQFDLFGTDPAFTRVITGFVAGAGPTCIVTVGTVAWMGGLSGRIYKTENPANGAVVMENGALTISALRDITAYSESFVVAVGDTATILYTTDGMNFQQILTPPVGIGVRINTVAISPKNKNEWWIGTAGGQLWYSTDRGAHWTQKRFDGDNAGQVRQVRFANDTILYFSHDTAAPRGRIFASFNGGLDFALMPMGSAVMPLADRFTALVPCHVDPELVVAAGLHDNGTDGIAVIGKM